MSFLNVNLEALVILGAILCSFAVDFVYFCLHVLLKKKNTVLICHFLYNCTYLTFDLTVTLNRKITLSIHPCIGCNSPRNNSSVDAKH